MRIFLVLIFAVLLASCVERINSKSELNNYLADQSNGLSKNIDLGDGINATMIYVPAQALGYRIGLDTGSKQTYFTLRLSKKHQQLLRQFDNETYSQILQTFSFRMLDYVNALDENFKEIKPIDALYQQSFGMTSYDELLFVFDTNKILKTKELKINITEFGMNLGPLSFDFETQHIISLNEKLKHVLKI